MHKHTHTCSNLFLHFSVWVCATHTCIIRFEVVWGSSGPRTHDPLCVRHGTTLKLMICMLSKWELSWSPFFDTFQQNKYNHLIILVGKTFFNFSKNVFYLSWSHRHNTKVMQGFLLRGRDYSVRNTVQKENHSSLECGPDRKVNGYKHVYDSGSLHWGFSSFFLSVFSVWFYLIPFNIFTDVP